MAKNERFVKSVNGKSGNVQAVDSAVVDTDAALTANSDAVVSSQKAVKSAIATAKAAAITTAEAYTDTAIAGVVKKVSVTLSNAQIKLLHSTPVVVAPAPGVGKRIAVIFAHGVIDVIAGAYANIAPPDETTNASNCLGIFMLDGALQSTNAAPLDGALIDVDELNLVEFPAPFSIILPLANNSIVTGNAGNGPSLYENKPLTFQILNGAVGDVTGGNAANTIKLSILYVVMDM